LGNAPTAQARQSFATLNSFDRQFVNNLSQAIRRRFTFITVNIPDKRPGSVAWTNTSAPVPLALQEYSVVMERAAGRVAKRLTTLDTSKTAGMLKGIREQLMGPLAPLMVNLFDLVERVRYAGPDQKIPHLPIGTAQIIDTLELFILRVMQDDAANTEAGSVLDWAVSVKIVPHFDSDVVAPEALKEFAAMLMPPFDKYTKREFLNILAAGMHFVE